MRVVAPAVLAFAGLIGGCGGTEALGLAQEYGLRVQAFAYENRQPMIVRNEVPCTELIVAFSVRATVKPVDERLRTEAVLLSPDGSDAPVWQQTPSPSESGIRLMWVNDSEWLYQLAERNQVPPRGFDRSELVLYGIARGCASPMLTVRQPVRVAIRVTDGDQRVDVTVDLRLEASY